jgi:uncharacterized integral membrane protein
MSGAQAQRVRNRHGGVLMTYYQDPEYRADHPHRAAAHGVGTAARLIVIGAIALALVLVGLDNRTHVRIGYLFGEKQAPVWIVIVLAAAAGVVIGRLARRRGRAE